MLKILHSADIHLGAKFSGLGNKGASQREQLRATFKNVIATAIIGLSHNLRLKVIAEGVESNDILGFLAAQNCDMYQGYYFSKPLPGFDFVKFLIDNPGSTLRLN